jgi:hypothetical protein
MFSKVVSRKKILICLLAFIYVFISSFIASSFACASAPSQDIMPCCQKAHQLHKECCCCNKHIAQKTSQNNLNTANCDCLGKKTPSNNKPIDQTVSFNRTIDSDKDFIHIKINNLYFSEQNFIKECYFKDYFYPNKTITMLNTIRLII